VNLLATVLALLSAMTFAVSTSVQHQAAEGAPASAKGPLGWCGTCWADQRGWSGR